MAQTGTMQAAALTTGGGLVKGAGMTRTLTTIIAVAAAATLASCDSSDHTIVTDPAGEDPQANAVANISEVRLPPSIAASKTYRCKDNSLVYIDWLSDGSARVKKSKTEVGTPVMPGETPVLQGTADAPAITYNGQSCKG